MANIKLNLALSSSFVTTHLAIKPELVGASHKFLYDDSEVKFKLPSKSHVPKEPNQGEKLSFFAYRKIKGKKDGYLCIKVCTFCWTACGEVIMKNRKLFNSKLFCYKFSSS